MDVRQLFSEELAREGAITRRMLERVPEGRDDWKPHAKSMPLGRLAMLVATMPSWITMMMQKDEFDLKPAAGGSSFAQELRTNKERVDALEKGVTEARAAVERATDEDLLKPWRLLVAGNVVSEKPRHVVLRDTINHLAHHRGQLSVYLRLNDVPVPPIYGPTADEQGFD